MPLVVTAIKTIGDPRWGYHDPATSTGGAAVLMLVNGPIAREIDINCGNNLFGPGWRANAAIGRAVRLVMRNVINTLPGKLDCSTFGHGGKYTFCIAENEDESPWPPVHVERGYQPEQNTITVFAALAPQQVYNEYGRTGEDILKTICAHMRISTGVGFETEYVLIIAPDHMKMMVQDGWSKSDIKRFCFDHTKTSCAELKGIGVLPGKLMPEDQRRMRPLVPSPEDFMVVAAGGLGGPFSAFIPGWGPKAFSESVTKEILRP